MPTYDYECLSCGENFEAFQKMSDAALTQCPKCKGKVKRLISAGSGFIFKGNGFYATDYRKKEKTSAVDRQKPQQCAGCDNSACSQSEKK